MIARLIRKYLNHNPSGAYTEDVHDFKGAQS